MISFTPFFPFYYETETQQMDEFEMLMADRFKAAMRGDWMAVNRLKEKLEELAENENQETEAYEL